MNDLSSCTSNGLSYYQHATACDLTMQLTLSKYNINDFVIYKTCNELKVAVLQQHFFSCRLKYTYAQESEIEGILGVRKNIKAITLK